MHQKHFHMDKTYLILLYIILSLAIVFWLHRYLTKFDKPTKITFMSISTALLLSPCFGFSGYLGLGGPAHSPIICIITVIPDYFTDSRRFINYGNGLGNLIVFTVFFVIYFVFYSILYNILEHVHNKSSKPAPKYGAV